MVVGVGNAQGDGPVIYSDDLGNTWHYGVRSSSNLLGGDAFDIATYPLDSLIGSTAAAPLLKGSDVRVVDSLNVSANGKITSSGWSSFFLCFC